MHLLSVVLRFHKSHHISWTNQDLPTRAHLILYLYLSLFWQNSRYLNKPNNKVTHSRRSPLYGQADWSLGTRRPWSKIMVNHASSKPHAAGIHKKTLDPKVTGCSLLSLHTQQSATTHCLPDIWTVLQIAVGSRVAASDKYRGEAYSKGVSNKTKGYRVIKNNEKGG